VCSLIILVAADKLQKVLGRSFVIALEKLMGLILVAISIEMMIRGIKSIF
jgi:small neutral amino acid transporter SnatA (MarC family)